MASHDMRILMTTDCGGSKAQLSLLEAVFMGNDLIQPSCINLKGKQDPMPRIEPSE
jgi:hypothetical protein